MPSIDGTLLAWIRVFRSLVNVRVEAVYPDVLGAVKDSSDEMPYAFFLTFTKIKSCSVSNADVTCPFDG